MKFNLTLALGSLFLISLMLTNVKSNAQCPSPAVFGATITVDSTISCFGLSDGGATASAPGGQAPFTFNWSNGASTASITGVSSATYTATITDNNGCSGTATSTITQPTNGLGAT